MVTIGMRYRELRAAKAFGKMPHEFSSAPVWSRSEAIAFTEAEMRIENYINELPEK